jgi:hypothetical protein
MFDIRLQFVLGASLSSRLIAWYGQGYGGYSHVDAVLPDGRLLGARSDAVGGVYPGVRVRPAHYEKWVRRTVVELQVTEGRARAWVETLQRQVGCQYDKQAILGFILGRREHTKGHWICSALQTHALKRVHLLHQVPILDSQVTPDNLFTLVTAGLGGQVIDTVG